MDIENKNDLSELVKLLRHSPAKAYESAAADAIEFLQAQSDALRADLQKAREQEPVGFIDANGDPILSVDGLKGGHLYRDPVPAMPIPKQEQSISRKSIIDVLLSTAGLSEGITADAIIEAIGTKQSPAVAVPDECCATGQSCEYEICTLNGEQQCKYCGKKHPDMQSPRITEQDAREIAASVFNVVGLNTGNMVDAWIEGDGNPLLAKLNEKNHE